MKDIKTQKLKKISILLFWLLLWELAARITDNRIILVGPIESLSVLFSMLPDPLFWRSVLNTLVKIMSGFLLSAISALLLGALAYFHLLIRDLLDPVISLMRSITVASFVMIFVWLEYRARSFTKRGYFFDDPRLKMQLSPEELQEDDPNEVLPNPIVALVPIVVILVLFNIVGLPVETAVFIGVALATILFFPRIEGGVNGWIKVFNKGAADSGVSILNTAIVVGFGGVVQNTQGFTDLVASLQKLDMNPLISACLATGIVAAACGSCSGGLSVFLAALGPQYVDLCNAQGIPLEILHRSITWAGAGLDSLPHSGGYVTAIVYTDVTPKESYPYFFVTNIGLTSLGCILTVALYMIFGLV